MNPTEAYKRMKAKDDNCEPPSMAIYIRHEWYWEPCTDGTEILACRISFRDDVQVKRYLQMKREPNIVKDQEAFDQMVSDCFADLRSTPIGKGGMSHSLKMAFRKVVS